MSRKSLLAIGVLTVMLVGAAAVAPTSDTATRPDLTRFVLRQADVPGSTVIRGQYVKDPDYVATYERELDGGRFRSLRLSNTEADVSLCRSLADAKAETSVMRTMLTTPSGAQVFMSAMKEGMASEGGKVLAMRAIRRRTLAVGDGGAELAMSMKLTGGELGKMVVPTQVSITTFRVDRVVAALWILGAPNTPLPPGDVTELAKTFAGRISAGLAGGV